MNKAYTRINFQNTPSTATPLNATNMNKIDKAINDIDNRVIELAGYQEEAQEAAEMASSSASAASKAAQTAAADAEARVNEVIQGLEVYTKEDSHKKFAGVIKQTVTGSPILIKDSADAGVIDFKGKGRSTQNGTPTPDSPIEIKSVADSGYFDGELLQGYYNESGGFLSNTSYVCSKNLIPCNSGDNVKLVYGGNIGSITFNFYDKDMNVLSRPSNTGDVTEYEATAPINAKYVHFMFREVSGTITPQTAKHITVTINGKYALIVKSNGKNLLPYPYNYTTRTYGNVTITDNGDGSLTANGTANANHWFSLWNNFFLPKGKYTLNGCPSGGTASSYRILLRKNADSNDRTAEDYGEGKTFEVTDETVEYTMMIGVMNGATVSNLTFKPMLRRVEVTDGTYEPYKETVSYITLNEPLRSISKYSDVIKSNGVGRNALQITYNGSESGWFRNTISGVYCFSIPRPTNTIKGSKALCTHYVNADTVTNNNAFTVGTTYINVRNDDITTVADWKAKLAENPITVIMPISEEEFEPFAEPVDIVTYDNVTYLTASDDAEMEVTYATDTKSYIDSKFAELHTALVNML